MPTTTRTSPEPGDRTARPILVRGVVGVIERRGRWLMIQRGHAVRLSGAWCFPGGTIEPGESPADALVREINEELSIRVAPGRHVWSWTSNDGGLELQWWTAEIVNGTIHPDPDEVADWRWVKPVDLGTLPGLLANNHLFAEFAAARGLWPC